MKMRFKEVMVGSTLGKIFINNLILTKKWLNEYSQKSHFPLSLLHRAWFYGQTVDNYKTTHKVSLPKVLSRVHLFAHQVPPNSQNASRTYNSELTHSDQFAQLQLRRQAKNVDFGSVKVKSGLDYFVRILNFERIKVRIFNGLYTFWSNKRLRWGMIMLLIVAPLCKYVYLIFPFEGLGEYLINWGGVKILNVETFGDPNGWYWQTFYFYFFSIGQVLAPTITFFGIFLLFPKKYYPSYLIAVPFGYYLSSLIHRLFFVDSFDTFHGGATTNILLICILLAIVFFIVSDHVIFQENHVKRAAEARIIGLINMPGMEWTDKEPIIKKEVAEVMKVDNELFIKEVG